MAGFDDIAKKAADPIRSEKAQKALNSEKGEQVTDKLLDGVAGIADRASGGRHQDKIAAARKAADEKLGRDDRRDDGRGPNVSPGRP